MGVLAADPAGAEYLCDLGDLWLQPILVSPEHPVSEERFIRACNHSQNLLRRPFCEMLLPHPDTGAIEHWEYDREASFC